MFTSERLKLNEVYTRSELKEKFRIKDATINNGIFRPGGHNSIWLFVTKEKTNDRTQYLNELKTNDLFMDGQTAGRSDKSLIEHDRSGLEIILFYRESKNEHPGAGFRYEGRFKYVTHQGVRPAHFHFRRVN
jgi:putative restriction endonuclease